jgi:hypothetical protein
VARGGQVDEEDWEAIPRGIFFPIIFSSMTADVILGVVRCGHEG